MRLNGREVRAINEVRDALGSSLDLKQAWSAASPFFFRVLPADYAAFCVTRPGTSNELEWILSQMPARFFEAYADMAPHDFVFDAVRGAPNRALRDCDMIGRRELESNLMYGRARDLGMPLEHVMSTLLSGDGLWSGGISLYRADRCPFSDRDRHVLEELIPTIQNTLRNCRSHDDVCARDRTRGDLLSQAGHEVALLGRCGSEIERSAGLTRLIDKWFSTAERQPGRLPAILVKRLIRSGAAEFRRTSGVHDLVVRAYSPAGAGAGYSALLFREVPNVLYAPPKWRERLTRKEFEVADRVVRGWDNRLVADDLGCTEETVKTHLKSIYDKLGVSSRAHLTSLAFRALFGERSNDDET